MNRLELKPSIRFCIVVMAGIVLIAAASSSSAVAQTTPSVPDSATPATSAPATKVVPPATAKQTAAQARAAARAERIQERQQAVAARKAKTTLPATATPAPASVSSAPAASSATAASSTPARATPRGISGAVGTGTLSWATRVYSSSGCVHNGNRAVCTFTFVNQGNAATILAGGHGELSGIQLVDDAHVPHPWDAAYFMDKYGAQQRKLVLQPGDTGTYVVGFSNVDPHVAAAEFHLRDQIVGGITVGAAGSNPESSAASKTK